jgi:hypothetical protein
MRTTPFDSIESAQEYIALLAEQVDDVKSDILGEIELAVEGGAGRRVDALRVVDYKLKQLTDHLGATRRILRDLRSLRRLLTRDEAEIDAAGHSLLESPMIS